MARPYDVRLKRLRQIFGFEGEPEIVGEVLGEQLRRNRTEMGRGRAYDSGVVEKVVKTPFA